MPFNKDIQGTTPKATTSSPVQAATSAMVTAVQKSAAPCGTGNGRMEPKQHVTAPDAKRIPDAKKPADAGRIPHSVTPVTGTEPVIAAVTEKVTEKDAHLVSTL